MSTAEQPPVSRGLLIVLGAVLGVAFLAALWFFVVSPLFGDEPVAEAPAAGDVEAAEEPDAEDAEEPDADLDDPPPPETDEVFSARDPFQQLVEPASQTTAVVGGDDGDDDSDGADGDGDGDEDGDDEGDDEPAPGVRVGETTVRLVEVVTADDGRTRVVVEVNGEQHEAAEEETFAERFRVLDISGDCATFLFGDNRFTLCQGESIRK